MYRDNGRKEILEDSKIESWAVVLGKYAVHLHACIQNTCVHKIKINLIKNIKDWIRRPCFSSRSVSVLVTVAALFL